MHKKITLSALSLLFLLQGAWVIAGINSSTLRELISDETENKDEATEIKVFNFLELPIDLQGYITTFIGAAEDSVDQFKQKLLNWQYARVNHAYYERGEPSGNERSCYGFSGRKTPIHFYTYKNKKPSIIEVGCILDRAKPQTPTGWYVDTRIPTTRIFLNNVKEGKTYEAPIEHSKALLSDNFYAIIEKYGRTPTIYVCACTFSVYGDVAIAWQNRDQTEQGLPVTYVTFANVAQIKKGETIDLDKDKILLNGIEKELVGNGKAEQLKGILFNLRGTKLATLWLDGQSDHNRYFNKMIGKTLDERSLYNQTRSALPSIEIMQKRKVAATGIQLLDAPSKDTAMEPNTILKRLMIAQKCIVKKESKDAIAS